MPDQQHRFSKASYFVQFVMRAINEKLNFEHQQHGKSFGGFVIRKAMKKNNQF